jgi:hypothetical protein
MIIGIKDINMGINIGESGTFHDDYDGNSMIMILMETPKLRVLLINLS